MTISHKRRIVIGASVVAAAAFTGGALAATQSSGTSERQAFLNDAAKRLHVSPSQLSTALQSAAIDRLKAAVAAGRLTQAEANELEQRIKQGEGLPLGVPEFFEGPHVFGLRHGPRKGFGPPSGVPGPGLFPHPPLFGAPGSDPLSAASRYLGLTDQQLFDQLRSGKSLADIAKARGKSVTGLKGSITAATKANLDKAVKAKALTSSQEQEILRDLSARLDFAISHGFAGPGHGVPGPGFGFRVPGKPGAWRSAPRGGRTPEPGPHAGPAAPGAAILAAPAAGRTD